MDLASILFIAFFVVVFGAAFAAIAFAWWKMRPLSEDRALALQNAAPGRPVDLVVPAGPDVLSCHCARHTIPAGNACVIRATVHLAQGTRPVGFTIYANPAPGSAPDDSSKGRSSFMGPT